MSEEFNWKQFLKNDGEMTPLVEEGAIVDPRSGEIVVRPYEQQQLDKVNLRRWLTALLNNQSLRTFQIET
jgi:hypothetical protein